MSTLIAAVQFEPEHLNVEKNLKRIQTLTFEAATNGAKIVVFPELITTGPLIENETVASGCSQQFNGNQTQQLIDVAASLGVSICFGYVEKCDNKYWNSAQLISGEGVLLNVKKHNLRGYDNLWTQTSDEIIPMTSYPGMRISILIGDDIKNRAHSEGIFKEGQQFIKKGSVDLVLHPSATTITTLPEDDWMMFSEEIDCPSIHANQIFQDEFMGCNGGSCIITKDLRAHKSVGTSTDGVEFIYQEI